MRNPMPMLVASPIVLAACGDPSTTATEDPSAPGATGDAQAHEADAVAMSWHRAGHRATLVEAIETWKDNLEKFGLLALASPPAEARMSAMASTTVHDVLNAVQRRYQPYACDGNVGRPLTVEAAIATGASDVLSNVYIGFHFRHATDQGLAEGRLVNRYVGENSLQRAWNQ